MQITRIKASYLLGGTVVLFVLTGCNRGTNNTTNAATSSVANSKKVAAPVKVEGKTGTTAPVKMTLSQEMGVNILKALNTAAQMNGHKVSVGTTPDTVMLNGKVKNAAQKKLAETIARQKAPKAKVINQIEVSAK